MARRLQVDPGARAASGHPATRLPALLAGLLTLAAFGCGGGAGQSLLPPSGQPRTFRITPATLTLAAGQNALFAPSPYDSGRVTWSVAPATAGTIDPAGSFTASTVLGDCQVVAAWWADNNKNNPVLTATATVTVVAPPRPAVSSPNVAQASGAQQGSPGTGTLGITQAGSASTGYLSAADWNSFNGKGAGTVTGVTASAPLASSGGATPT